MTAAAGRSRRRVSNRATRPWIQSHLGPPGWSLSPMLSHQGALMDIFAMTSGSAKHLFSSPLSSSSIVQGLLSCRKNKQISQEKEMRCASGFFRVARWELSAFFSRRGVSLFVAMLGERIAHQTFFPSPQISNHVQWRGGNVCVFVPFKLLAPV